MPAVEHLTFQAIEQVRHLTVGIAFLLGLIEQVAWHGVQRYFEISSSNAISSWICSKNHLSMRVMLGSF
jgi:hypothetical protein